MRAVVQRVKQAEVKVASRSKGIIGGGLMVLLGVHREDTSEDVNWMADKLVNLRIFEDDKGLMNRSLLDVGGEMMLVSQFTLLGDCRKGRRPSFVLAAGPEKAEDLYEYFVRLVRQKGINVKTGIFRAMMDVSLVNDGPVTLILESRK